MTKKRMRIPLGLPISIAVLLIVGIVSRPIISSVATEQKLANNVLLLAIPFVCFFAAIVLAFITVIAFVAGILNHNIPATVYRPIELTIIGGIVLGVIGMFQPWWFIGFRAGFFVLLISTLGFIFWSHIIPKGERHMEESSSLSISKFEQTHG